METLLLKDVMTREPETIGIHETLLEAQQKMVIVDSKHLPVIEGTKLVGIISDRDIGLACRYLSKEASDLIVDAAYVRFPYSREPEAPLPEVLREMIKLNIGSALVVEDQKLVGIFTVYDACSVLVDLLSSKHE